MERDLALYARVEKLEAQNKKNERLINSLSDLLKAQDKYIKDINGICENIWKVVENIND